MAPQRAFVAIAAITRRSGPVGLLLLAFLMGGGALALLAIPATEAQSAPSPPSSVSVTHGDTTLTATWPAGSGATTYWVAYKAVNGGWNNAAINHPTTSITIPNVDNTLSYVVMVASRNATGDSGWTESAPSGPYAPWFKPAKPASVSVTRGDGTLTATWPAVSGATGYQVAYWFLGGSLTNFASNHPGTSVTITGVDNAKYYHVGVSARNQYGEGEWQTSPVVWPYAGATTPTPTPPAAPDMPASVSVTRGDGTMTVTWTAASRATGYGVLYSADDSSSWSRAVSNLAVTSYTITGVDNTKGYSVAVYASNSGGHSQWNLALYNPPYNPDAATSGTTPTPAATATAGAASGAPATPASVILTRGDGTVTAAWSAVAGATSYRVEYSTDNGSAWSSAAAAHTSTGITVTNVNNAKSYQFAVRAVNSHGSSGWSLSVNARPYDPSNTTPPPAMPTAISVTRGDGTVTAAWPAVDGAVSYHVAYVADGASWANAATNQSGTSVSITGADNAKSYVIAVRARSANDASEWRISLPVGPYNPTVATTATPAPTPQNPPGTPASVSVTRGDGTLTATWLAVDGATSYHVTYTANNGASWSLAAFNHPFNSITISGVDNGKSYIVGVRARNSAGGSGWRNSPTSGAYVPTTSTAPTSQQPPERPASVSVTRSDGTLTATWPAVDGATSYHVTYTANNGATWSLAALNHPNSSITITGVDNGKSYIVGVRARNSAGDSGWRDSPSVGAYVPATNPTPTTSLTTTASATTTPTPTPPPAPATPATVSLARGDGTLTATWPAVAHAATYHVLYPSHGSSVGWGLVALNPPVNSVTIGGVDNSKSYYVLVRARNAGGDSGWRISVAGAPYSPTPTGTPTPGASSGATPTPSPTPIPSEPPGTPASVSVTRGDGELTATWPAVKHAATYHVTYTSNNGASWSLAALNHTGTSITISNGIDNAKTYHVAVRARNSIGDGEWRVSESIGPHRPAATPTPTPAYQTSH